MANVLIGAPVFSDVGVLYTPTFSGGSWEAGNPLTNLQDRRLHRVARSSGVTEAQTVFTADLGAARPVRVVAIPKHTLTLAGRIRARGFVSLPALDSLTVGDAAWTADGTPTRTAEAFTAPDGVPLDLIEDNDAGTSERYSRAVTFTGNAQKVVACRVKAGTATNSTIALFDATAATNRLNCNLAWSGGVPSPTFSVGSLISLTLIGDGVYRIVCLTTSVTAANTNRLFLHGATDAIATTGSTYYGSVTAWDATTDQLTHDSGFRLAHPSGWTAETRQNQNTAWVSVVPSTATDARYWRINVRDTANPAGFIDLARLIIAGGYQPSANFRPGAVVSTESDSVTTYTDGGSAIHDPRPPRRVARFSIPNVSDAEAWLQAWRTMRQVGPTGQVFLVLDPDADADTLAESAFLCVPREASALEFAEPLYRGLPFAFAEEL